MINNWIKEDKEFVLKGLGLNGQETLKEENKKYIDKTFLKRKLLINKLFELLDNLKEHNNPVKKDLIKPLKKFKKDFY